MKNTAQLSTYKGEYFCTDILVQRHKHFLEVKPQKSPSLVDHLAVPSVTGVRCGSHSLLSSFSWVVQRQYELCHLRMRISYVPAQVGTGASGK